MESTPRKFKRLHGWLDFLFLEEDNVRPQGESIYYSLLFFILDYEAINLDQITT